MVVVMVFGACCFRLVFVLMLLDIYCLGLDLLVVVSWLLFILLCWVSACGCLLCLVVLWVRLSGSGCGLFGGCLLV